MGETLRDVCAIFALGIFITCITSPQVHAMAAWIIGATAQ